MEREISDEKGEFGKQKQEKLCKIWEINDDETNCILTKLKRHKIIKNTDTDSEVMCMKNKISICILVVLGILLTVWVLESIDNRISQKQNNEDTQIQIAETQSKEVSKVVISYEYIVKNDNGMITVYKNYGTDKFFDTGVYYNELPEDIKSKINNGFGFETESELYDFLESYSS